MIPFTTITLDRPRRLRFGMSAMCEFEQLTGIRLTSLGDDISMDTLSKLLWVMLKQDEPTLTLQETCALVDENTDDLNAVITAVGQAIQSAFAAGGSRPNALPPPRKGKR